MDDDDDKESETETEQAESAKPVEPAVEADKPDPPTPAAGLTLILPEFMAPAVFRPAPVETETSAVALAVTMPQPVPPAGFDYDALGPELAQATRARVANIHRQNRNILDAVWVIGMEGAGLRDSHPYGVFMQIVGAEFGAGYWHTLNRCINVYERLGDGRFSILRNLRLNDTTLYALAMKSTPEWVRYEIADGIQSGAIPTDKTLDAEIKQRIKEARDGGFMPQTPRKVDAANARQLQRRDHAIAAVRILKSSMSPAEYQEFNHLCSRAGPEFDHVRLAKKPGYGFGFVTGEGIPISEKGPLTDKELEDYELDRDSTPLRSEWEDALDQYQHEQSKAAWARMQERLQQEGREGLAAAVARFSPNSTGGTSTDNPTGDNDEQPI